MRESFERAQRLGKYKCPRSISSLLQTCEVNCRLLGSYAERAQKVDRSFIFDAAAKLRLLCIRKKRSNTPLLLELCERLNVPTSLGEHRWRGRLDVGMLKPADLPCLLHNIKMRAPLIGTGIYELTIAQIIESYTEKAGGAHVDWTTSGLIEIIQSDAGFDGVIFEVASASIFVANRLFKQITPESVQKANQEWVRAEAGRLLDECPDNVIARRELALVLIEAGDSCGAIEQLNVICQQEPEWPEPRIDLARIALDDVRNDDCQQQLMAILESVDSSPILLLRAAELFTLIGDNERAADALEVICQLKGLYGFTLPLNREVVLNWFATGEEGARLRAENALAILTQ